jgi:hypothetical protein
LKWLVFGVLRRSNWFFGRCDWFSDLSSMKKRFKDGKNVSLFVWPKGTAENHTPVLVSTLISQLGGNFHVGSSETICPDHIVRYFFPGKSQIVAWCMNFA